MVEVVRDRTEVVRDLAESVHSIAWDGVVDESRSSSLNVGATASAYSTWIVWCFLLALFDVTSTFTRSVDDAPPSAAASEPTLERGSPRAAPSAR